MLRERRLREEGEGPTGGPECSARERDVARARRVRLRWLSAAMLDWAVRWAAGEKRLGRALKERGSGRGKEKWAAGLGCWVGFLGFGFLFLFLFLSSFLFLFLTTQTI